MKKLLGALILVVLLMSMLTGCGLHVPRPSVKEAKFNFTITYELSGEVKTLSGIYECEFDGTSWSLDGGYSRDWDIDVEGDYVGDDYTAIIGTTEDGGSIVISFGFNPQYFMGDTSLGEDARPQPTVFVTYPETEAGESKLVNDPTEVAEIYGAKLIGIEYDPPIENSFSLFDFF